MLFVDFDTLKGQILVHSQMSNLQKLFLFNFNCNVDKKMTYIVKDEIYFNDLTTNACCVTKIVNSNLNEQWSIEF